MRAKMRIAIFSLFCMLVLTGSLFAQESGTLNSDELRRQAKTLEAINVEGKSESIRTVHQHALLTTYQQLQASLERDQEDPKNDSSSPRHLESGNARRDRCPPQ